MARLPVDPAAVRAIVIAAAAEAVMPRYKSLAAGDIRTKSGPNDLVTEADLHCQAILAEKLGALLPEAAIVGEEDGATATEACAAIAAAEWCWIIDPLDGTHNFAHGKCDFAVMVALAHRGETVGGWIHQPLTGEMQMAVRGEGASSESGRLRVAEPAPLGMMVAALYIGAKRAPAVHARAKQLRAGALGPEAFHRSAGSEYLGLAAGRIHYAIFTLHLPWDHAPGALIFAEAGGYLAYWDGQPYRPSGALGIPLLLAPNEQTWRELRAVFDS